MCGTSWAAAVQATVGNRLFWPSLSSDDQFWGEGGCVTGRLPLPLRQRRRQLPTHCQWFLVLLLFWDHMWGRLILLQVATATCTTKRLSVCVGLCAAV